jgi:Putative bacterial sensory transduction regulator
VSNVKVMRSHVERCLQDIWQVCRVKVDADGDYPFRRGTASGFVRVERDTPSVVRVFAFAALDTPRSAKLLTELNDINRRTRTTSLVWADGAVIVEHVLLAAAVKRGALRQAIESVGFVADDIGTMITTVFGGRTPYEAGEAKLTEEAS